MPLCNQRISDRDSTGLGPLVGNLHTSQRTRGAKVIPPMRRMPNDTGSDGDGLGRVTRHNHDQKNRMAKTKSVRPTMGVLEMWM